MSISGAKLLLNRNQSQCRSPDTDDEVSVDELPLEIGSRTKKKSDFNLTDKFDGDGDVKNDISRETEYGDVLSIKDLQRVEISDILEIPDKISDTPKKLTVKKSDIVGVPDERSGTDGDDEESIEEVILQDVYSEKKDELSTQEIPTAEEFKSMIEKYIRSFYWKFSHRNLLFPWIFTKDSECNAETNLRDQEKLLHGMWPKVLCDLDCSQNLLIYFYFHNFFDISSLNPDEFPVKVFRAKYTYDPSLYSPNEDHDMELPLIVGSYIYVYGETDDVSKK